MFFFLQYICCFGMNKKNKNKTLQVRIPIWKTFFCGKRTSSPIFLLKSGSLTIEASIVLPLFLFVMLTMMMPFSIMDCQRQVQAAMESVCEDLSRAAYVSYELKENKVRIKLPEGGVELGLGLSMLEDTAMMEYAQVQVREKLDMTRIHNFSLLKSEFMKDGETIKLVADYELILPFSVLGISGIPVISQSCRRAWIGEDGGWLDEDRGEGENKLVYIGKSSTRYHLSRTCHYLYNRLTIVDREGIESYRNVNGAKYYPCAVCGRGMGGKVYIMPSGTRYHGYVSCTAIISYVRAVKKSEVAHLGACSNCSGG